MGRRALGRFRAAAIRAEGQAGRARAGHHQARRAGEQESTEPAVRERHPVRRYQPPEAAQAERLLLPTAGQQHRTPPPAARPRAQARRLPRALGAQMEFLDGGDYPRRESGELVDEIVRCYRRVEPAVVLTHALADPYNPDHPAAARMALQARVLAQAIGYDAPGDPLGAPPVFLFEPHQPEQCDFKPQVLLDITEVFAVKRRAMECLAAQQPMWDYYTDLARRRGVQLRRNAGPNLGLAQTCMAH